MVGWREPLPAPLHTPVDQAADGLGYADEVRQVDGERIADVGGGRVQGADVTDVQDAAGVGAVQGAAGPASGGVEAAGDAFVDGAVEEEGFGGRASGAGLGESEVPAGRAVHASV